MSRARALKLVRWAERIMVPTWQASVVRLDDQHAVAFTLRPTGETVAKQRMGDARHFVWHHRRAA